MILCKNRHECLKLNKNFKKKIVLMGIKHCGKSTMGRMLAKNQNLDFYDIDQFIVQNYNQKQGLSVREIFIKEGEKHFREIEALSACILNKRIKPNTNAVIALGGSTIENEKAIECVAMCATMVYLKENADILYKRIIKNGIPPFIDKNTPYKSFLRIYENRSKLYEKRADLIVDINGLDINKAFNQLLKILMEKKICQEIY